MMIGEINEGAPREDGLSQKDTSYPGPGCLNLTINSSNFGGFLENQPKFGYVGRSAVFLVV